MLRSKNKDMREFGEGDENLERVVRERKSYWEGDTWLERSEQDLLRDWVWWLRELEDKSNVFGLSN